MLRRHAQKKNHFVLPYSVRRTYSAEQVGGLRPNQILPQDVISIIAIFDGSMHGSFLRRMFFLLRTKHMQKEAECRGEGHRDRYT